MSRSLVNFRVDDIPLLYSLVRDLGVQGVINGQKSVHGNWSGVSAGQIVELWLCYILSESDHRLQGVEAWAETNDAKLWRGKLWRLIAIWLFQTPC